MLLLFRTKLFSWSSKPSPQVFHIWDIWGLFLHFHSLHYNFYFSVFLFCFELFVVVFCLSLLFIIYYILPTFITSSQSDPFYLPCVIIEYVLQITGSNMQSTWDLKITIGESSSGKKCKLKIHYNKKEEKMLTSIAPKL